MKDLGWAWKGKAIEQNRKKARNRKKREKQAKGFYKSWEWLKLRYEVLKTYGPVCMLCGSTHSVVVDHIKEEIPRISPGIREHAGFV